MGGVPWDTKGLYSFNIGYNKFCVALQRDAGKERSVFRLLRVLLMEDDENGLMS